MSKDVKYCAVGDYGVEAYFDTEQECQTWIKEQEQESGENLKEYYRIRAFTQAEIDRMPED